jgi:hypothetical protein
MRSVIKYLNESVKRFNIEKWASSSKYIKDLDKLFKSISKNKSYKILDCGSGKSSLYYLTTRFLNSKITAIVYPGDKRKITPIKNNIISNNYTLVEKDIMKYRPSVKFDIVLCDKILGEATKFGGNFNDILNKILSIPTKYLIIYDGLDDPNVDFNLVHSNLKKEGYKIINKVQRKGRFTNIRGDVYATAMIGLLIKKE